jgi:hypothetical protein
MVLAEQPAATTAPAYAGEEKRGDLTVAPWPQPTKTWQT